MSESEKEAMYLDILKGLAVQFDSPLVTDIRETAIHFPRPALGFALNRNQTTCKKWLVDTLFETAGGNLGRVCVLGGWFGVLGAMLLHDPRFKIDEVCSVDLDPSCEEVALCLNKTHAESGRFKFLHADMYEMDFKELDCNLIVNTSCEHLESIGTWYERIPSGTLLTLQSNNYFGIEGHVNCVDTLDDFKQQVPLSEMMFEGELTLKNYTRFMLIGRR